MRAISIWLSYGMRHRSIQNLWIRGSQESPKTEKILKDGQKDARVEMAASMLSILEPLTAQARSWALTEDQSWFYFSYDYERKWALARDPSTTKLNALINTQKS
jgi:hypothetical protein